MACLVHVSGLNPIAVSVCCVSQSKQATKKQQILTFEKMERRTLCVLCKESNQLRCEKKKKTEAPGF